MKLFDFSFGKARKQAKEEERKQAEREERVNNLIHTLEDVAKACCADGEIYESLYIALKRNIPLLKENKIEEKAEIALTQLINNAANEAMKWINCDYAVAVQMLVQEIVGYLQDWISGNTYYSNEAYSKVKLECRLNVSKRNRLNFEADMLNKEYLKLKADSSSTRSESSSKDLQERCVRRAMDNRSELKRINEEIALRNKILHELVQNLLAADKEKSFFDIDNVADDDVLSDVVDIKRDDDDFDSSVLERLNKPSRRFDDIGLSEKEESDCRTNDSDGDEDFFLDNDFFKF